MIGLIVKCEVFVKMKMLCCLILVFTGGTAATVQPKSVNLALETVLQFDKKNHEADLEVINRVQKFIDNIKDVMSVYDGSRHSRRSSHESLKFTDFILEVVNIIRSYNDSDLKQIITVLDDESRKYNYKGCKFYELLDNRSLRRFMSRNLQDAKEIPLEKLRNLLDVVADGITNQKFKKDEKKLLSLVNSLYSGSEKRFTQVLSNLNNYSTRRSSMSLNLRDIVSKGLKNLIFDFYSNLNPNARTSLKSGIHNYWRHYLGGKDRHANVASTKREKPRSHFIDFVNTRYSDNDMHKWSARAKRTKDFMITTPILRMGKSIKQKANSHKRDSLGLSVDFNYLKPVFQSFLQKISSGTENKKTDSADIIPIKKNKMKTKHKNVKHSKQEAFESFIEAMPMPDSFEASERDTGGHEKPRTAMMPYDEYETTTKKKRDRKSRHKEEISLDHFLKSKSEIRSEIRDLDEIQKKYDKLKKLQSNLSPEVKSDKEDEEVQEDMSGLEFIIGGQKVQDMPFKKPKLTKHERISKTTAERENEADKVSDHQAVTEVTESKELKPNKRLRTPHKTAKKPKKHRRPQKSQTTMFELRSAKKKTRRERIINPFTHASNEGMSIESYENERRSKHSAMRGIKEDEAESFTENLDPQSATDRNVVSMIHKLEKELENVKAKIKHDATLSTNEPGVNFESLPIDSIADDVPTGDILPVWPRANTAKTKTIIPTTLKVVSQEKQNARREQFTKYDSKNIRDTLFQSNNITYNSKFISPLQVLLNQTMAKISSYLNESISSNKNKYNVKDIDFDISDDLSKSNERTQSVTTTTVTKVPKTSQESFEKDYIKISSKEKPKRGSQSLEEEEKKTLSKEKLRKGSQYLEEEKKTLSKENVPKGSQYFEEVKKKTLSKEKVSKETPSSEEGKKKPISKENVTKRTKSLEVGEKITVSKENVKNRSQPLEKGEKITVSKEKVKNASQSLDERKKSTVSKEKVKKETQSVKEIEKKTKSKENVGKGSQSLEEGEHSIVRKEEAKKESSDESEKQTVSKENAKKVPSSEEDEKGTVSEENIGEGSLLLLKDKNETKSHDNESELDRPETTTTPTIGSVSLSSPIMNDFINKTEIDARKLNTVVKDESRINNISMIPPEVDPAINDLVDDESLEATVGY